VYKVFVKVESTLVVRQVDSQAISSKKTCGSRPSSEVLKKEQIEKRSSRERRRTGNSDATEAEHRELNKISIEFLQIYVCV
ncbi:hypothetical protein Taro_039343, partial [Colocasia esculenta]|nr:hypothetical protein [Colocasia esculenta]